jgi:hypothetical protein
VYDDSDRTEVASAGVLLSDSFQVTFEGFTIPGDVPRRPELAPPPGPSTMGGVQARQSLTLKPVRGNGRTFTVGWANVSDRRAQLRTHKCLHELHVQHFGKEPFTLDEAYFQIFFDRARAFLSDKGLLVEVETRPPASMLPPSASSGRVGLVLATVLLVLCAAAAGFAYWFTRLR